MFLRLRRGLEIKREHYVSCLATLVVVAMTLAGCSKPSEQAEQNAPAKEDKAAKKEAKKETKKGGERLQSVTLPEGTTIDVVLDQSLSSSGNHSVIRSRPLSQSRS